VPRWKRAGYVFEMYENDHPPLHVHVFLDGKLLDRFDLVSGTFMRNTIGRHRGRVLAALRKLGLARG
jgi:hypothetical protein